MTRNIATNRSVERDELLNFIRPRHKGILSTQRQDKRPQMSLVTMGVNASGKILISSYPERVKVANARRNPEASICVMGEEFNSEWVQVDGHIEVLDLPAALDGLCEYFQVISGDHPDWEEYKSAMVKQGKVLLELSVERWSPISKGGFPARLIE